MTTEPTPPRTRRDLLLDLDVPGLSSYPQGLDQQLPFGAILWWTNGELIHHGAELGLLRDLWAARLQRP